MYLPSEMIELDSNDEYRRYNNSSACRVKFLPDVFEDGSKSVCLKFSETSVLNPGTYRLIYFGSFNKSVLGVSKPFIASKHKCPVASHEVGW